MGLLDFFKKNKTPGKIKAEATPVQSDNLTDSHQIKFHLEEMIEESGFVNLILDDDSEQKYSSIFLRLEKEEEKPGIFMDTVIPEAGNDLIMKSKKITFDYIFKGKHYGFESKYLGMEKEEFTAIKISMPQEIKNVEHRKSVKIRPSFGKIKAKATPVQSDNLTDSHQVKFHLEEMVEESGFVNLILDDDSEQKYSSIFLRLEKEEEKLGIFMDTVIPEAGNDLIMKSKKITFNYIFKGKHYGFESKYLEMEKEEFTAIKISMPQEIKKVEHRKSVRIRPSFNDPVYVLSEEGGVEEVADIGAGGLAFYTERILEGGEIYDKFTFTLPPDNHKMHTPAEVTRFIDRAAPSRKDKHICCIKFINMKQSHTEMLIKYIFQRERQTIQEKLDVGK